MSGQALVKTGSSEVDAAGREDLSEFVTFNIAGQLFGIPVLIVQDILLPKNIASIPLAPPEVRGSINLRGRIVTVLDVRVRLGLERRKFATSETTEPEGEPAAGDASEANESVGKADKKAGKADDNKEPSNAEKAEKSHKMRSHMMGVTVEHTNELYTLLVDSVGDVISISKKSYEGNPSTLDPLWREFSSGVYRLDTRLMVVLDVDRLLDFKTQS